MVFMRTGVKRYGLIGIAIAAVTVVSLVVYLIFNSHGFLANTHQVPSTSWSQTLQNPDWNIEVSPDLQAGRYMIQVTYTGHEPIKDVSVEFDKSFAVTSPGQVSSSSVMSIHELVLPEGRSSIPISLTWVSGQDTKSKTFYLTPRKN